MKSSSEDKTIVLSVERALTILDALVENKGRPKGITELSKDLGLVKGTVCKLINTLEKKGYMQKELESDKYRLGFKFMEIGSIVKNSLELRSLAEPFLKDLEEITQRTIHMALLVDSEIVYIDKVESRQRIQMASYVGQRSFIHSTSLGKAICAYLPEEEVKRYLKAKGMPKLTANTITTVEEFIKHLRIVRECGYAVDENENEESIRCVAVPIFDYSGRPVAALSVSGTVMQVSKDKIEWIAAYAVREAENISRKMGYTGFYNKINYRGIYMDKYVLKAADIEPLLEGLAILGTGGGGSPKLGRAILENEFRMKREITIVDPNDISDDAFVASGGIMGSVSFLDRIDTGSLINQWEEKFELMEAMKTMSSYKGKEIDYVVPFEVGGLNTPVILSLAARMGISTIDGDSLGRSAPETQMASFLGHDISLVPMPLVDMHGNTIIVTGQGKATFADEIGRWMITKGGGMGANSHYPMSGVELKRSVIPNTITKALKTGRSIISARNEGRDPIAAVIDELKGLKLFQGRVYKLEGEDKGGFYITNVMLGGTGVFEGVKAKLVIKNETMALWIDGKLKSVFPDLVCMLDVDNGSGILSTDIEEGKEMVLIGQSSHERLRAGLKDPEIAKVFSGSRYGHPEISFVPMEEL